MYPLLSLVCLLSVACLPFWEPIFSGHPFFPRKRPVAICEAKQLISLPRPEMMPQLERFEEPKLPTREKLRRTRAAERVAASAKAITGKLTRRLFAAKEVFKDVVAEADARDPTQ